MFIITCGGKVIGQFKTLEEAKNFAATKTPDTVLEIWEHKATTY